MKEVVKERLRNLRIMMKNNGLKAFLVNGSDPHLGEYLPSRWETREFISGFTGSYGWLAITEEEAVIWTDSRYYVQYEIETKGTGISIEKARLPETTPVEKWISQRLKNGETVGFDGSCYSAAEVNQYEKHFYEKGIKIDSQSNLIDLLWKDRPSLPVGKAFLHPIQFAGLSRKDKFNVISDEISKAGGDITIISALDDLAWTFNIRGADVEYNPVVLGYGIVGNGKAVLFIDIEKFDESAIDELKSDGVELLPYISFYEYLLSIDGKNILIDSGRTNYLIEKTLSEKNTLIEYYSIPNLLKSRKNKTEIDGMKKANATDGIALLDLVLWLEENLGKEKVTEYDIVTKLNEFRSSRFGFRGQSFHPIVGYKDHGAIVHLHVSKEFASTLEPEGALLIDSGGQYDFGTTDTTRTIVLGQLNDEIKSDFTLALKGMIALSSIKFPRGTIGCHLDILARSAMWKNNLNYGHGTCHGVGSFLNVHEGPMSIRQDLNNQPIVPGNVLSNEPGIYKVGKHGVRTENVMVCVEDVSNEFGDFYRFETLTMFPIDARLIDRSLINEEEIMWINNYHQQVLATLSAYTSTEQFKLLRRLTQPL